MKPVKPQITETCRAITGLLEVASKYARVARTVADLDDDSLREALRIAYGAPATRKQVAAEAVTIAQTFRCIAKALEFNNAANLGEFRDHARALRENLVAQGEVVRSQELVGALKLSRQALSKAVHEGRCFYLELGGERFYPAFYADSRIDRPRLEQVIRALGERSGWEKWHFFSTRKASLGSITPLEALREGRYSDVLTAATGFAE